MRKLSPEHLRQHAANVAMRIAREHGLHVEEPRVLSHWSNVLVHLSPSPVVARVAATTTLIRPDVEARMRREVDLVQFLHRRNAPVVPPTALMPAGPLSRDGLIVSFWQYIDLCDDPPNAGEMAQHLRDLHVALNDYDNDLPDFRHAIAEIGDWIDTAKQLNILQAGDSTLLLERHSEIFAWFAEHEFHAQALHGDAQAPNLLRTQDGRLLWNDFEDACRGPIEWDLTCFARRMSGGPEAALLHYPNAPSWEALSPFLAVRNLQGTVWYAVLAAQGLTSPDIARERIAGWRQWGGMPI